MGARSGGRAVALQVMFALDAIGALDAEHRATLDVDNALVRYWASFEDQEAQTEGFEPDARVFGDALVRDLVARLEEVDATIRKCSTNWRVERMPRVDRNVARIGSFELMARPEVPRAVIIDEAVELAKRFGGDESAKFVNGVLERVADEAGRGESQRGEPGRGKKPPRGAP
jgi:N utilization substance protein B